MTGAEEALPLKDFLVARDIYRQTSLVIWIFAYDKSVDALRESPFRTERKDYCNRRKGLHVWLVHPEKLCVMRQFSISEDEEGEDQRRTSSIPNGFGAHAGFSRSGFNNSPTSRKCKNNTCLRAVSSRSNDDLETLPSRPLTSEDDLRSTLCQQDFFPPIFLSLRTKHSNQISIS